MQNRGCVFAFELNKRRCELLCEMMEAKGASIVVTKHASFLDASPDDPAYAAVTHVLLDPSCSSSGMSRTPERDPTRLRELADAQEELILHAMSNAQSGLDPVLKPLRDHTCMRRAARNLPSLYMHHVCTRVASTRVPRLPCSGRRRLFDLLNIRDGE